MNRLIKIGMILGNRYEIMEKIGAGGMSIVYKAKCHKLNRYVAVKILRQEFLNDETFVTRFRVEAQAAASLTHPNIINVFDVGSDENIHYIVMEYIEGVTIKEYIRQKGEPLSSKETIEIALKIAEALRVSHANKIVHRDIKPQNIIISNNKDVKVTDFGIARATTSNTITTNASAIGSVHYFSPEQARGGYVDDKSDLYSLGITMYEMVTNTLPFQAESPVSVAIQHIKEELPKPSSINEKIWSNLEAIILKATQKKPERRYQKADEIIEDMKKALQNPSSHDFVELIDINDSPTINMSTKDMLQIKEESMNYKQESNENPVNVNNNSKSKDNDKIIIISAILTSFIIIGVLLFAGFKIINSANHEPAVTTPIELPNLAGKEVEEARIILEDLGIELKIAEEKQDSKIYEEGLIISQTPETTLIPEEGSIVEVVISKGYELKKVPNVVGKEYEEAIEMIEDLNVVAKMDMEYHDDIPIGNVISQNPSQGEELGEDKEVTIIVSQGIEEQLVMVPKVTGLTVSQASTKLTDEGLNVGNVIEIYHDEVEEGKVIFQTYEAGIEVEKGKAVDLNVSKGIDPEKVTEEEANSNNDNDNDNTGNDNPDLTNTDELVSKNIVITDLLSSDVEEGKLTIIMQDSINKEVIFNDHVDHDIFPLTITVKGKDKATIQVRLDNILIQEDPIIFD